MKLKDRDIKLGVIFCLILFGITQLFLYDSIIGPGYLDTVPTYELGTYNPEFEKWLDSSLVPPNTSYKYGPSVSQDGLFYGFFEEYSFYTKIFQVQLNTSNNTLNPTIIHLDNIYFQQLKNSSYHKIVGNTSHVWIMSPHDEYDAITSFQIESFNIISLNITMSSQNFTQNGLKFVNSQANEMFYYKHSIWLHNIYENASTGSIEHYLSQYNPSNLSLIEMIKLPIQFSDTELFILSLVLYKFCIINF